MGVDPTNLRLRCVDLYSLVTGMRDRRPLRRTSDSGKTERPGSRSKKEQLNQKGFLTHSSTPKVPLPWMR